MGGWATGAGPSVLLAVPPLTLAYTVFSGVHYLHSAPLLPSCDAHTHIVSVLFKNTLFLCTREQHFWFQKLSLCYLYFFFKQWHRLNWTFSSWCWRCWLVSSTSLSHVLALLKKAFVLYFLFSNQQIDFIRHVFLENNGTPLKLSANSNTDGMFQQFCSLAERHFCGRLSNADNRGALLVRRRMQVSHVKQMHIGKRFPWQGLSCCVLLLSMFRWFKKKKSCTLVSSQGTDFCDN